MNENANASHLGRFVLNLALLLALGVLVLWWFLHHTSLFPAIAGLLGLGGVLVWVTFISGLLTDERKKQLKHVFEERILIARRTPVALSVLGIACLVIFSFFGSVEIAAIDDGIDRTFGVEKADSVPSMAGDQDDDLEHSLPPGASTRLALPTPLLGSRMYRIVIPGLAAKELEVRAWHRSPRVTVPTSFPMLETEASAPVLLLWPSPILGKQVLDLLDEVDGTRLLVRLRNGSSGEATVERILEPYHGEAVWLGRDDDHEFPQEVLDRWEQATVHAEVAQRWRSPRVIAGLDLQGGDEVELVLDYRAEGGGSIYQEIVRELVTVRPVVRPEDVPQTEELDGT